MEHASLHELAVTIRTDESMLTLTPRGLLEFFLPGAKEITPGVWQGQTSTGKACYVQTEALAGALMECREKQLNPVTEIYILPSNSPQKRSGHKVRYTVGLERLRDLPGFLGLNSGLILMKDGQERRTSGSAVYPGYEVFGAWAKAYFEGLPEPLEHEVSFAACVVEGSPNWDSRPGFMILKVVEDELWRLKALPRMKPQRREELDGETIILEGKTLTAPPPQRQSAPAPQPAQPAASPQQTFNAGEMYEGLVANIYGPSKLGSDGKPKKGSVPGSLNLKLTEGGTLRCIYWDAPAALQNPHLWPELLNKPAVMSFRWVNGEQGKRFAFIDTLDIVTETQAQEHPPAPAPEPPSEEPPPADPPAPQPEPEQHHE